MFFLYIITGWLFLFICLAIVNPFGNEIINAAPVGNPFMVDNTAATAGFNQFPTQQAAMPGMSDVGIPPQFSQFSVPSSVALPNGTFQATPGQPFPVSQSQGFPTSQPAGFLVSQAPGFIANQTLGFPVTQTQGVPAAQHITQPFPTSQIGSFSPNQQWGLTPGQAFGANSYMCPSGMIPTNAPFAKSADIHQQWAAQPAVPAGNPFMVLTLINLNLNLLN